MSAPHQAQAPAGAPVAQPPTSDHDHTRAHQAHAHTHGIVDPTLFSTDRGIWALKWSLVILLLTAAVQTLVYFVSGSVALLADTIHNFSDALTAIPLAIAFVLAKRSPTRTFTFGYGHIEDLAGLFILALIVASALITAYESFQRLLNPQPMQNVWFVVIAAIVGFIGNEAVALFRIRVGNEIGSAALIADGYHARIDGLTSLAVLLGAAGALAGFPLADPLVGLGMTLVIGRIAVAAGRAVLTRLLGGVDPEVVDEIERATLETPGVSGINAVRVRWLGHRLIAELNIVVGDDLTLLQAHHIAVEVEHNLMHHLTYLSGATIHVDPAGAAGDHQMVQAHAREGLEHSH
jgi:cation diffusion facilitator family transporter